MFEDQRDRHMGGFGGALVGFVFGVLAYILYTASFVVCFALKLTGHLGISWRWMAVAVIPVVAVPLYLQIRYRWKKK